MIGKVGDYLDSHKNQLPYGGATDIRGRITWVITKEEHDEMLRKMRDAFDDRLDPSHWWLDA
jgi:hypothetical protein